MILTEISNSEFLRLAKEDDSRNGGLIYQESGMAVLYMELNPDNAVYTLLNHDKSSQKTNTDSDE